MLQVSQVQSDGCLKLQEVRKIVAITRTKDFMTRNLLYCLQDLQQVEERRFSLNL